MGPATMREFVPSDRAPVLRIWEAAFLGDNAEPSEEWFSLPGTRLFVWESDGRVCATARVHEFSASRGAARLRCGGLAVVAVALPQRRAGLGGQVVRDCLYWMRQEGFPISSLYAFREAWYRPFGYEVCGRRWRVAVPADRLPASGTDLEIREARPEEWPLLEPCHGAWVERYSGMNTRTEDRWRKVLAPSGKPQTILIAGSPAEAYVVLRSTAEFSGEQALTEAVWATARGYSAFLDILLKIGMNRSKVSWYEPPDLPYVIERFDSDAEVSLARPIMFRVNDVPAALRGLVPDGDGEFTLEVLDEIVPENRGPWAVRFRPGEVDVMPSREADLAMDIRAFSQALLGQPSLCALAEAGRLAVCTQEALAAASLLLPPRDVYCLEFF
jgi:predicted acetyltransferase